jgi:hypothetical protein
VARRYQVGRPLSVGASKKDGFVCQSTIKNCSKGHCSGIGVSSCWGWLGAARRMLMAPTTSHAAPRTGMFCGEGHSLGWRSVLATHKPSDTQYLGVAAPIKATCSGGNVEMRLCRRKIAIRGGLLHVPQTANGAAFSGAVFWQTKGDQVTPGVMLHAWRTRKPSFRKSPQYWVRGRPRRSRPREPFVFARLEQTSESELSPTKPRSKRKSYRDRPPRN